MVVIMHRCESTVVMDLILYMTLTADEASCESLLVMLVKFISSR